jgi:hypothetical protein
MAITIRQRDKKWRIEIREEEFEFENRKEMDKFLQEILAIKEKRGQKERT